MFDIKLADEPNNRVWNRRDMIRNMVDTTSNNRIIAQQILFSWFDMHINVRLLQQLCLRKKDGSRKWRHCEVDDNRM